MPEVKLHSTPDDPQVASELEVVQVIFDDIISYPSPTTLQFDIRIRTTGPVYLILSPSITLPLPICILPPLVLSIHLPSNYPTDSPSIKLQCPFVSLEFLFNLANSIESTFISGSPSIFEYVYHATNYVHDNLLKQNDRGLSLHLHTDPAAPCRDKRIARKPVEARHVATILQTNAEEELKKMVVKGSWKCPSCWDFVDGKECVALVGCGHVGCEECLKAFWESRIEEGRIDDEDLVCMTAGCGMKAGVNELKRVIDKEMFEKYERYSVARFLDRDKGCMKCVRPGCKHIAYIREDMGKCPGCGYVFCLKCENAYHGVQPCKIDKSDIRRRLGGYWRAHEVEKEGMKLIMKKEGIWEFFSQKLETAKTLAASNTKRCPKCGTGVAKEEGCNHMKCACGCMFCWACGTLIEKNYSHFSDGQCDLYSNTVRKMEEIFDWVMEL